MTKKSKQVENRIESSEHVGIAAKTHRDQIADALGPNGIADARANR